MSKTTKTKAPEQKKNVGYRLLAVLILAACVSLLFLPFNAFTGAWALEKQTLIETIKALTSSDAKLFGVLPALVSGSGVLPLLANVVFYGFAIAMIVAAILSLIAIFAGKKSPCLVRAALFFCAGGAAGYAVTVLFITRFVSTLTTTYDIYTMAIALACAVFYFILMLAKLGKGAWLCAANFLLTLAVSALLVLAMALVLLNATNVSKWVIVAIVAFAMINLIIAAIRAMSAKGLSSDIVRYSLQLIVTIIACYVSYKADTASNKYVICCIIAAIVAALQMIIVILQLIDRNKKNVAASTEAALADFETEEYVEAYAYDGGPVAGVEIAEEVNPTEASKAEAEGKPNLATLVGNGFDAFMFTLNNEEKEEFIDLYILRCKANMPEIPAYVVGGDNKEFFNKVFIYLGQYREKISNGLLAKMYKFSMKLS